MRQSSRLSCLALALLSSLHISLAQINTTCPVSVQNYNASGLLGFFDSIVSNRVINDDAKATIENDGYLYSSDNSSPSPPASFAYALTFTSSSVPADNGTDSTLPAVLTTLLATAASNATTNSTLPNTTSHVSAVACGMTIRNLPARTTRLGQDDDGTCTSTLPHGCAKKILNSVAKSDMQWPNGSNDLETTCSAYASALETALNPNSETHAGIGGCRDLFIVQASDSITGKRMFLSKVAGFPLTSSSHNEPVNDDLPYQCNDLDVVDGTLGRDYVSIPVWNDTLVFHEESATSDFETMYGEETYSVYPIITLILREPDDNIVNEDVDVLSAHLGCVRTTGFSAGSKKLPALKDYNMKSGLSAGAIAGIVIGIVIVLAAIGFGIWRWKRWQGGKTKSTKKGEKIELEVRNAS